MSPPSRPALHLLIPFASTPVEVGQAVLKDLRLPQLQSLLRCLTPTQRSEGDEYQRTPPHERVLAQAMGWTGADGCLPWAARQAPLDGIDTGDLAWGWLHPTHWHVGADHITMLDPNVLDLSDAESRALFDAIAPLFRDEGWLLAWGAPTRWYVAHESLTDLPTASLDRVIGRNPDLWMPDHPQARGLRRLQAEVQMLLYQHPINDTREARGALPVNSVWLSGCGISQVEHKRNGSIDGNSKSDSNSDTNNPADLTVIDALRSPLLQQDWQRWIESWHHVDTTVLRPALQALQRGDTVSLTLSGERHAQRFDPHSQSTLQRWWHHMSGRRTVPEVAAVLAGL